LVAATANLIVYWIGKAIIKLHSKKQRGGGIRFHTFDAKVCLVKSVMEIIHNTTPPPPLIHQLLFADQQPVAADGTQVRPKGHLRKTFCLVFIMEFNSSFLQAKYDIDNQLFQDLLLSPPRM
jgi:hypothetical protein